MDTLNNLIIKIIDYREKTPLKLGLNWKQNGQFRALSAKNVKTGKLVNLDSVNRGIKELYQAWMKDEINKNDILITSEAPFGEVYFWNTDEKIILSQRLFCIRPNHRKILPRYMYYAMCCSNFQSLLISKSTGSTVTGLRQPALLSCAMNVPEKEIQQHIVNIIYFVLIFLLPFLLVLCFLQIK